LKLEASISAHQTVGVETVLSTDKYRRLVEAAKAREFTFQSADLNIQRVRLRVGKGGHDVPEESIRKRWTRSLAQLPWFLDQADQAALFDNSGAVPQLVGRKETGEVVIDPDAPAALKEALGLSREASP